MSVSHKSFNAQLFRLMVYQRALHPELLNMQGRRLYRHGDYEAECWIAPSGHIVRFQVDSHAVTEVVIEKGDHLPELGLVHALPCLGEKDFTLDDDDAEIDYVTTVQTESLSENLYLATCREMHDFATEAHALMHTWHDEEGTENMSILDCQKFKREFHVQSYHLIGPSSMVLRTQSIFEMRIG